MAPNEISSIDNVNASCLECNIVATLTPHLSRVAYYARCRLSLRGRLKSFNSQISEQKPMARTRECCQIDARVGSRAEVCF
ncbi:hypothetical protein ALC62_11732 [Cyphomyrmex costatus]|uniref:Uncharacterized protein n=1 Tax=Cyphomyrmex costatus TaxID=456900 RepID=A0A195C9Q1_9HYME|nr:hypothetical protein ALC62_11732 [Cyphomyrmex costatus]